ncbi:MAG: uL30 family ribosomal protein [Nanoarchaeota archaeon]
MIAIIRIHGDVDINRDIRETFNRLRLRKKYTCVILEENDLNKGMIHKVKNFIAYGKINKEVIEKLIVERGRLIDKKKKTDLNIVSAEFQQGKKLKDLNVKPFFRLHPPRGGIDSKIHFGKKKGVLGDNKEEINKLIERML